jgi:hypothetical protein
MNCIVCKLETDSTIPYHDLCMECRYCNHSVGLSVVQGLQKQGIDEIYHVPCYDNFMREQFAARPVTITQRELDYLNRFNLMFIPNMELSIKSNQADAELRLPFAIADLNLDETGMVLKRMEALTAMLSIALSKHKDTIRVRAEERDRQRFEEVKEIRNGQQITKEKKVAVARKATERLDPVARAKENVIKFYMSSLGMTRESAEEFHNKQKGSVQ